MTCQIATMHKRVVEIIKTNRTKVISINLATFQFFNTMQMSTILKNYKITKHKTT